MLVSRVLIAMSLSAAALGCGPAVKMPPVHEPLDSQEWQRCAGELAARETVALIDDLTLDGMTMLCRGVVAAAGGDVNGAIELLTEAGVRDKADHRPHYLAGRILGDAGRYEEALAAFERSAARYPQMEVPTERLGRKVMDRDGDAPARIFLQKAADRGLCPYGCQGLLAKLYHGAGDDPKAEAIYGKMIEDDPGEPAAYMGMASLSNARGDHMAESEWITKAVAAGHFPELSDSQKADIHYSHAFARYNARKFKGAAASIDRAIALRGDQADWWVLAGWIQLRLEDPAVAMAKFEKAAAIDEGLAAAHTGRGDAMMDLRRTADAMTAYERAAGLDSANAVIVLKLAHATAVDGDLDAARALLDKAVAMDKDHLPPEILERLTALLQ